MIFRPQIYCIGYFWIIKKNTEVIGALLNRLLIVGVKSLSGFLEAKEDFNPWRVSI